MLLCKQIKGLAFNTARIKWIKTEYLANFIMYVYL